MPVVAIKVVTLLQDPKTTAKNLADAISRDPAVSARVLKIANSSFYSLKRQVKTLEQAIVVLGEKTVKSLVLAASLKGISRSSGPVETMLWEESMGCAIGARLVALRCRSAEPEEAFLGGMFRSIGKMVMNNLDSAKYLQVVQGVSNGAGNLEELERNYFHCSHSEIGEAVIRKWNFSESLILVVRNHRSLALSAGDDPVLFRLVATVNIADCFCRRLGVGRPDLEEALEISQTPGAKALGLDSEQLGQLLEEFKTVFERDREIFLT